MQKLIAFLLPRLVIRLVFRGSSDVGIANANEGMADKKRCPSGPMMTEDILHTSIRQPLFTASGWSLP